MKVDGKHTRSIWLEPDGWSVGIVDQTLLPHRFAIARLTSLDDAAHAIRGMQVRGAPLIGAAAAYGICLGLRQDASDEGLERAVATLMRTRPTAINLNWAVDEMTAAVRNQPRAARVDAAYRRAAQICDDDVAINQAIGRHGAALIEAIAAKKASRNGGARVNLLTHCNAGWLATVDVGTALAPVYVALPSPTIDFAVADGVAEIPIEERDGEEVAAITGRTADGRIETVRVVPDGSPVKNYGFDVTPARLVTGLITERGVIASNRAALARAFPERVAPAEAHGG